MALKHGNKTYMQILLDPNRAKLAQEQAEQEGIRVTAWIRNAVYSHLKRELTRSKYNEAEAADEAIWKKSIHKRVQGRPSKGT